MQLRPHQTKAVDMLRESFRTGHRTPLVAAPCGYGKTILAGWILKEMQDKGQPGLFVCDRLKLLDQTIEAFQAFGIKVGVIQSDHHMTDPSCLIQIASVQTLVRRKWLPDFKLAIVDEAHCLYSGLTEMIQKFDGIRFIGLSGTPYTAGLGKIYDDLLVPITPRELLAQNYLCPTDYYAGRKPDISSVKKRRMKSGGTDYDPVQLAHAIEKDKVLTGDIIENYIRHANGTKAIAFTPSVMHSKTLTEQFCQAGIPAAHIDGYMDAKERSYIYKGHKSGLYKILCCSRLLGIGFDDPTIVTEIDAYPTAKLAVWIQRCARIWRTHDSKQRAIYLDHSGNLEKFQTFPEDVVPHKLHDGAERFNEKKLTKKEKTGKVRECPQCYQEFVGLRCKCGFEVVIEKELLTDGQILEKCEDPKRVKLRWMAELLYYGQGKGYSRGWATQVYKEKFKEFPANIQYAASPVSEDVKKYLQHRNIKYARKHRKAFG
jgi:DNA repair protein RadD